MITKGFEIAMSFLRAKRCILPWTCLQVRISTGAVIQLSDLPPVAALQYPALSSTDDHELEYEQNDSRRVNSPVSHSATSPEAIKGFLQVIPKLMREYR